jgi:hypothetical protein
MSAPDLGRWTADDLIEEHTNRNKGRPWRGRPLFGLDARFPIHGKGWKVND